MSRRRFLRVAAGAGGLAALGAVGWRRAGQGGPAALETVNRGSYALGTRVSITVLHAQRRVAERAADAALAELDWVERALSLYRPDSQIRQLNAAGSLDDPHPYLVAVLETAQDIARRSDGAFDVTVQPLWKAYAAAKREGRPAGEDEIAAARARVGWQRVHVSAQRIELQGQGTAVTLNGIAQGFAADRVLAVLRANAIEHAMVDAGEVGTLGRKAAAEPWVAGIQHPRRPDAYIQLARLDGRCMSTSGDYATTFSDDHSRHHIFDPSTGRSPTSLQSVTVLASSGMLADALSTAVFVLGPDKGAELVRATPQADALFVTKDGRVLVTDGFPTA